MTLKAFFKRLEANFKISAPLYNWRRMLEGMLDFEVFRDNFLTLTGELSDTIVCVLPCSERCRIRKIVRTQNGNIRAVCPLNDNDYFHVPAEEIVVYRLDINALVEAIAAVFRKNGFKHPEPFLLPEIIDSAEEDIPGAAYPVQRVFPFAKRHIYKETDGESEKWYVDGKLKKVYGPKKKNCMQSKILNILYNQIGNGWIPHETFINMSGWTHNKYWGRKDERMGRMRQLLRHLRKHLDVEIIFSKEYGIRFSEEVVK